MVVELSLTLGGGRRARGSLDTLRLARVTVLLCFPTRMLYWVEKYDTTGKSVRSRLHRRCSSRCSNSNRQSRAPEVGARVQAQRHHGPGDGLADAGAARECVCVLLCFIRTLLGVCCFVFKLLESTWVV